MPPWPWLGLVMLVDACLFFSLNVIISIKMGWIAKFEHGLFGKFTNGKMFKDIVKTAAVSWHGVDRNATHLLHSILTHIFLFGVL